jgi:rhodanese-related sulfurtransferase
MLRQLQMDGKTPGGQDSISIRQLAELQRDHTAHIVLDVREADELATCRIGGAMHIPMSEVPSRLADLPLDVPIVVMCHHGARSMSVVKYLHRAGRENAVNLDGGIDAWARQIDPSMQRY